jgi:DNA-directed RNA polymerase sigma subunit (sigma70/sigma32)
MPRPEGKSLSQEQRREIFLALVKAQDDEMPVVRSRRAVAAQFGVSEQRVRQIEQEGLDGNWPPLG